MYWFVLNYYNFVKFNLTSLHYLQNTSIVCKNSFLSHTTAYCNTIRRWITFKYSILIWVNEINSVSDDMTVCDDGVYL